MPLSTGSRLGPYEVTSLLGKGGMGEVYRARDSKLGREVAIKVLPEAFVHDAARMARFGREAKLLAALNHPNIATIYGLEDSGPDGSGRALVMELAEGPTLADRISGVAPTPISPASPESKTGAARTAQPRPLPSPSALNQPWYPQRTLPSRVVTSTPFSDGPR